MELHYFTASWCAGCKQVKPYLEKVRGVEVVQHDVETEEGRQAAFEQDVQALPTVIAVEDGLLLWGYSGTPRELFNKLVELQ